MKYSKGSIGRTFVLQFEEGDSIYNEIEKVAQNENIHSGIVWVIGGVKNGKVVVGPKNDKQLPPDPLVESFSDAREIAAIGTLFENEQNLPELHMHASIGKGTEPLVGCPRLGLDCWLITEAVILELLNVDAKRIKDDKKGLELLRILKPE
ncbi:MAG TPA: DUF296 domain-containing protein [Chitinispirillaceae bacterium]|jgi:predicted DNA-binding protein with PD1-like motif|nr:DUF296 domain-containing protein [Chitinispirillaceae bacterium]